MAKNCGKRAEAIRRRHSRDKQRPGDKYAEPCHAQEHTHPPRRQRGRSAANPVVHIEGALVRISNRPASPGAPVGPQGCRFSGDLIRTVGPFFWQYGRTRTLYNCGA